MCGPVGWGFFAIYHKALVSVFPRCLSNIKNVLKKVGKYFPPDQQSDCCWKFVSTDIKSTDAGLCPHLV